MKRLSSRLVLSVIFLFAVAAVLIGAAATAPAQTAPSTTQVGATTRQSPHGPDTVMLSELSNLYQPVPFDHRAHAQMSEMWDGCTTCHHRTPTTQAASEPSVGVVLDHKDQSESARVPACKSCHEAKRDIEEIRMPSLKGAYHRQCLNCHREWANENACKVCHQPKDDSALAMTPTVDGIIDRMHPPLKEPDAVVYRARFTPAMGPNVTFRHKEHATTYGLKCVNCHRNDNCSNCHTPRLVLTSEPHVVKPGRTWTETHNPCVGCHRQDRCQTCHYQDGATPPPPFEHKATGQLLDKDHASLKCGQCHAILKAQLDVTCGDSACHKPEQAIAFPAKRPGPTVTTRPAESLTTAPSTKPAVELVKDSSGAVIKRVRRAAPGGER